MEMKSQTRVWMLIALSLIAGLSACILVPVGDGDHHGGGEYHEASVPDGRAANQPLFVITLMPPMAA
jgi:hypothetical protein